MKTIESWEVLAVSQEFLDAIQATPEALFGDSITTEGRTIQGSQKILVAPSSEMAGVQLLEILNQVLSPDRPILLLVRRRRICNLCPNEDESQEPTACPHGTTGRTTATVNTVFKISEEKLRQMAKPDPEITVEEQATA